MRVRGENKEITGHVFYSYIEHNINSLGNIVGIGEIQCSTD